MHLIHQKEVWVLTGEGWLVTLACVAALMLFLINQLYPFLALNSPLKADILVIEGWMQDYAIKEAIAEFERGSYQKLITIGPSLWVGHYLSQYKNFAELAAANLIALGFDPDKLVAVPTPDVFRNRTDASAAALSQWIANSGLKVESINLYTFDVHSRRNWMIFNQALAPEIKVGVIVLEPLSYDPKRWWVSSAGVRSIISETIAYIYARFVNWRA
jgi:hypothetical protein